MQNTVAIRPLKMIEPRLREVLGARRHYENMVAYSGSCVKSGNGFAYQKSQHRRLAETLGISGSAHKGKTA